MKGVGEQPGTNRSAASSGRIHAGIQSGFLLGDVGTGRRGQRKEGKAKKAKQRGQSKEGKAKRAKERSGRRFDLGAWLALRSLPSGLASLAFFLCPFSSALVHIPIRLAQLIGKPG